MSIRWLTTVWDTSPYEGTRLLIHLGMADHANEEGRFFISQHSLAKKARCSTEYIRKSIKQMQEDGVVIIERKGHSKGIATEYRLLPNRVVELKEVNSPTLNNELPNFEPPTPQLPLTTTILYNHPDTTISEDSTSLAKSVASEWWESQVPRPIGKGAWHSLLKVCQASTERGYSKEQILSALNAIGTVPSIQQMDKVLKGIKPMSSRQERIQRGINNIIKLETERMEISQ